MANSASTSTEPALAAAIEVTDLAFSWDGSNPVLQIPRFVVQGGERVFLHGPSGSGKSTLLAILGGVLEPSAGTVNVLGRDLATMARQQRDRFRAAHLGFIFQQFNLLPYLSILDNVLLPLRFSPARRRRLGTDRDALPEARRLLAALDLREETTLQRPVTALSQGQQQRVAAARALIGSPDLLIADEPTSSLDADARGSFLSLLMEECSRAGTTVIFVSHDRSLSTLFDRAVELQALQGTATA